MLHVYSIKCQAEAIDSKMVVILFVLRIPVVLTETSQEL